MTAALRAVARGAAAESALRRRLEDRTANCVVVGLGFIGTTVLRAIAAAGFPACGVDRSQAAVDRFAAASRDPIRVSQDARAIAAADVVVVAVRITPRAGDGVDLEPLDAVARALAFHRPQLVVLMTTMPPGTTRAFAGRIGRPGHVFVAHAPERLQVDDPIWTIDRIPHLVAGVDDAATRLGAVFVSAFSRAVHPVTSPEVAELAKLLENSFNAVGIALIGELTPLAHVLGIEMAEVSAAAATKPFGYRAFHPGPGVGGHCIPSDLQMLRDAGRSANVPTALLDAAAGITRGLPAVTVDRLSELFAVRGWDLAGAKVLLVGLGFKIGTADITETPARDVARELRRRRAVPLAVDSRCDDALVVDGTPLDRVDHRTLGGERVYDAAVILAGDPGIAGDTLAQSARIILDAGGGQALSRALDAARRL
jgi:UDP-N-acetyl-D-glucosamine dehydrogenase